MSEFYKQKRDQIMKDYKYLGIGERISFWFFRIFTIITIITTFWYLVSLSLRQNTNNNLLAFGIFFLFAILCFFTSKNEKKKHRENKLNAVYKFIAEPDINMDVVTKLIAELENYNKKVKTFATWIAGLTATFIVLLVTLAFNYGFKLFDFYISIIPEDELSKMLKDAPLDMNAVFSTLPQFAFFMLFLFCIVILIIYFMFSILTFVKGQILVFLYDVQYGILATSARTHTDISPNQLSENHEND